MIVLKNVLHNTFAQVSARARFISSPLSSTLCGCPFFDSLFLALFLSVCFSYLSPLLLPEPWAEPLPPCGRHRGKKPLALRQMRSLALWPITPLTQVMSPTSSTTTTSQRPLKSSSRMNPSTQTRNRRTRSVRNSTMSLSEKHYLHHCSFSSEKNQRTEDKLITLLKKVSCQLSPFLCVTQERWDPCTNLIR